LISLFVDALAEELDKHPEFIPFFIVLGIIPIVLTLINNTKEPFMNQFWEYLYKGEYRKALQHLEMLVKYKSVLMFNSEKLLTFKLTLLFYMGNDAETEKLGQDLLKNSKLRGHRVSYRQTLVTMGDLLCETGKLDGAIQLYTKANQLGMKAGGAYAGLALTYLKKKDPEQALKASQLALDYAGDQPMTLAVYQAVRARVLAQVGDIENTQKSLANVRKNIDVHHASDSAQIMYLLGEIYIILRQLDTAKQCLNQAIELLPEGGRYADKANALLKRLDTKKVAKPVSVAVPEMAY
jgi:tetratricopeptide (TPR) repeat protein